MWQPVKPKKRKSKKKSKWLYGIMAIYIVIAACAMLVLLRQSGFWHKSEEAAGRNVVAEGTGPDAENNAQEIDGTVSAEAGKSGEPSVDKPESIRPEGASGNTAPPEGEFNGETQETAFAAGLPETVIQGENSGMDPDVCYTVRGASSVRMWSEPEQQGAVVAALPEGSAGNVLEQGKYYSKIEYNGTSGYVYNGFLEIRSKVLD